MNYKGWDKIAIRATTSARIQRIKHIISNETAAEHVTYDEAIQWMMDKLNKIDIHV